MFKLLKIYAHQEIRVDKLISDLINFGYHSQSQVLEEGDFSHRGEVVDIYPATFECPVRVTFDFNKIESIVSIDLSNNRVIYKHEIIIILPKYKNYRSQIAAFDEKLPLNLFVELKRGDYVVHVQHGIGKYLGIEKIGAKGENKGKEEYFVIEYANREKLFVPGSDAHLIQKFIGLKGRLPKINRLGTKEWSAAKSRIKKGIKTVAIGLLKVQAERLVVTRQAFRKDSDWQLEFEKRFLYKETADQIKAMNEVKKDMESFHPMDRLLCGDVGYGKTEVALRAAFKAVMDNKQAAFLVPTTILAEQHYQNFIQRLKDFPVKVEMLSRFRSESQAKEIVEGIKNGIVDIVIGTHRLLSGDIVFKDLGLLIIDEEQRFGVSSKEKIKSLKPNLDILTLTATPIPRTLYMSLMGLKDISAINTPPQNRLSISTFVIEYDEEVITHAIKKEFSRGGQIFFVHNEVKTIEKVCEKLKRLLSGSEIKITYAHGQMPERELEEIMVSFLQKKIDCLVSTTIIGSGIDIPLANTIIVNNAHTFGLSDLHQLRGRVGRFDRKAYGYFLIPQEGILNEESRRRLKALREYSQLGAGFRIAMEDLEIRGAGNLLGYQQHGYIQAVGFDLYCRLLKEMVSVLKRGG